MGAEADVLVTGANGFFGLAIVRGLTLAGYSVIATDRSGEAEFRPRPGTDLERVVYVPRDVAVEPLVDLVDLVATVVHAAALTPAVESGATLDALLSVNLTPLTGLLGALRVSPRRPRLIFISSAGVYQQQAPGKLREEDAMGGTSLYGAAKLAAELVVARYATLAQRDFCMIRPTSLFGPGEWKRLSRPRTTPFRRLVDAIIHEEPVQIREPSARTDWLHVDDAADAVTMLVDSPRLPGCPLNLSSARSRPFAEIVDELKKAGLRVDPQAELVVSAGSDRPAVIDNARLRGLLDWSPERSPTDAVRSMVAEAT
jgi:nucleoside-diphosphate-sugar epimerase